MNNTHVNNEADERHDGNGFDRKSRHGFRGFSARESKWNWQNAKNVLTTMDYNDDVNV